MITQIPRAVATMAGPAGAAESDEDRVILRDGSTVVVRPLATGDVAAIAAWFEGLGPETRHARFLGSVAMLDDRTRSQLAQVDHRDHEALTAVNPTGQSSGSRGISGFSIPRRRRWRSPWLTTGGGGESRACSCSRSQRELARRASTA